LTLSFMGVGDLSAWHLNDLLNCLSFLRRSNLLYTFLMESTLIIIVGLIVQVLLVLWMVSVLRYLRESRMIHSMTLKVLLLALSKQGIDVDIEKIQNEVKSRM